MSHTRAVLTGLLALAAASSFAAPPTAVGKSEGELNIIAWAGYIERGETVKEYDWTTSKDMSVYALEDYSCARHIMVKHAG